MLASRSGLAATLFLGSVVVLSSQSISGQNPPPPKPAPPPAAAPKVRPRPQVPITAFNLPLPLNIGNARGLVQLMRDGKQIVLDPATKKPTKEHQDAMNLIAKELVYVLTDKQYYMQQEPNKKNELIPKPVELSLESRFEAAERFILVPSWNKKLTIDQADYIVGFGEAMDAAVRDILEPKPAKAGDPPPPVPDIMRVNAARMMAIAARSGAPAHYPTILKLIQDPNTDPAILIYAIKAAEGFIAAFNPILMNDAKYALHVMKDAEMLKLTEALDAIVKRTKPYGVQPANPAPPPAPRAADPKAADPKAAPPKAPPPMPMTPVGELETTFVTDEQKMVLRYFRRAAIRALAQVRVPVFVNPQDGHAFRPLMTLAKIAVGDASITATPGNDEIAIAVMGLCNLHDYKDVNVDVLCDLIAQGTVNFAGKKAGNAQDKSLPWKVTGSLLISALTDMTKPPNAARYRNKFESLSTVLIERLLVPLEKVGGAGQQPNLEAVARWREQNAVPELKLYIEAKEPPIRPGFVSPR